MYFIPTPTNMVAVLVSALSIVGIAMLMRKRYDSNIPLLFFMFAIPFTIKFDRPVDPTILYGSLAVAALLRFEFMGVKFTKVIAMMTTFGLAVITWILLSPTIG
jgi:hypothetical protein